VKYLLGGLAPDSDAAMAVSLQQDIQRHWHTIQKRVPGTMFDFDFWRQCTPRRSTYPACRAVIAAKQQGREYEIMMIYAIQTAYYLQARNPSNHDVLIDLAEMLALNIEQFRLDLNAPQIQTLLLDDIRVVQSLGAYGFPSLVLQKGDVNHAIVVDYNDVKSMLKQIRIVFSNPLNASEMK